MTLLDALSSIEDPRGMRGRRHPLPTVMPMVIMAIMSGYTGYRAIGEFIARHKHALVELLGIPRSRVPSYSTVRRLLLGISFTHLNEVFSAWMCAQGFSTPEAGSEVALDGKSIKSTVEACGDAQQDFIALVSAFSHQQGLVLGVCSYSNKHASEISVAQALIERLRLEGVTFTMDALHCQKKRSRSSGGRTTTI